jgi:putative DNA primase/helicase
MPAVLGQNEDGGLTARTKDMDLLTLRAALGGEISARQLLCPGPNHSPLDRSLSVKLDPGAPDGFICFSHAGDSWQDCKDYVRRRLGLPAWQPGDEQDRRVTIDWMRSFDIAAINHDVGQRHAHTADEKARMNSALKIWGEAIDPRNTLAEKYLNEQRMFDLPVPLAGNVLRFHPRCPWRDESTGDTVVVPALIAAFRSIDDDRPTGVHRIALRPDGTKRDRRMLGVTRRAVVKLDAASDTLAIGEGIETAMAARELGFSPAWALGSVGAITSFPVIEGVKTPVILGERGKASADAVAFCAPRWHAACRKVQVVMPEHGSDLNDELILQKTQNHAKAATA